MFGNIVLLLIEFLICTATAILFIWVLINGIKLLETILCVHLKKQPPFVPATEKVRKIVSDQINQYYTNAKSVVDIGSGYGFLTRHIAKNTNTNVIGLENMFFSALVAKILDKHCKGSKTIWCNAFDYLGNTNKHFDIALAYLGPNIMPTLTKYSDKFDVLISVCFEIPTLKPVRIIDAGGGFTYYGKKRKKFSHRVFVYDFRLQHSE